MNITGFSRALWEEFGSLAQREGHRIALRTPGRQLCFAELFAAVEQSADLFRRAGIRVGDLVGLALPNGESFVISFLALCRLSAIVALISPKYHADELGPILRGIALRFVLTTDAHAEKWGSGLSGDSRAGFALDLAGQSLRLVATSEDALPDSIRRFGGGVALIKFTSGTTGEPKGIALSAGNLLAEARNVGETLSLSQDDRILVAVSLSHSYGFDLGILAMLDSGAQLVVHDGFIPRRVMRALTEDGITVFLGVPSMYRAFLDSRISMEGELGHVRYLLSCTAPLSPETITQFQLKFGAVICQHYGSSETGAATTHIREEVPGRIESVGRAMHNVRLAIEDANGHRLAPGMDGEVVVTSGAVALGYVMGAPVGSNPLQDGTYRTGDIGYLDEEGFLYIKGRKDQLINVGGHKVAPDEVVWTLETFPAVREAAVLSVRDRSGEETVYAVVTLRGPATENDLLQYCRSRLAEYKVPRRIDIRVEMPRAASGKIDLRALDIGR